jgi:hypothetical protein
MGCAVPCTDTMPGKQLPGSYRHGITMHTLCNASVGARSRPRDHHEPPQSIMLSIAVIIKSGPCDVVRRLWLRALHRTACDAHATARCRVDEHEPRGGCQRDARAGPLSDALATTVRSCVLPELLAIGTAAFAIGEPRQHGQHAPGCLRIRNAHPAAKLAKCADATAFASCLRNGPARSSEWCCRSWTWRWDAGEGSWGGSGRWCLSGGQSLIRER